MGMMESVVQVGWDCHRRFSQLAGRDARNVIVWRRRLEHADRQAFRRELRSWPPGMAVVLEGTYGWGWVSQELQAAGHRPHLASSGKVAAWRVARGLPKSNRRDSELLSELFSEKSRWWEVWLPPNEVQEQRELLRHRMGLVQHQTALKNRMHAVLHRHGILHSFSDLFGRDGRRFLQQLAGARSGELPASGRIALKQNLQMLDHVRRQIAAVTRMFRQAVQADADATRLRTLPGVSWILAYTLGAEIGRIERFRHARQLVAYAGLAPLADDSGDDDGSAPLGRHVSHLARRTLQWALIEAAHSAVLKDPRLREIYQRYTDGGRRNGNRGYILVARHLAVLVHSIWRRRQDYNPAPPPRPGMERRRRRGTDPRVPEGCPRTGWPDDAMARGTAVS